LRPFTPVLLKQLQHAPLRHPASLAGCVISKTWHSSLEHDSTRNSSTDLDPLDRAVLDYVHSSEQPIPFSTKNKVRPLQFWPLNIFDIKPLFGEQRRIARSKDGIAFADDQLQNLPEVQLLR